MNTKLLRIISILILATIVLTPQWGLGAGATQEVEQPAASAAPTLGTTTRISVASDGSEGNEASYWPSISADGRFVAFDSGSSNLVYGDTNWGDVFVHDQQTGTTERVSVVSDGSQGNGNSAHASISADGQYVAFESLASNLVSGDTNNSCDTDDDGVFDNNCPDIFVHDRQTGSTQRVSLASDGSQGNFGSTSASISADGRYVAFNSEANNLVSGDTNGYRDVFVHDRQTETIERVSVASDTSQGNESAYVPSISADGRYVAFNSNASNLVNDDTNGWIDIFVHDMQTGSTERVSVASDGSQGNSNSYNRSISADGRFVAFISDASNLVSGDINNQGDVFTHDRETGITMLVSVANDGSQANNYSLWTSISDDGRYVAFTSQASNLVRGDVNKSWDVFVHDRQFGITQRVSKASDGSQGNDWSGWVHGPSISKDGRYVAFISLASNLVSGDNNGTWDIFVHERKGINYIFFLPVTQNQP